MPLRQSVRLGLIVGALFLLSACATTRVATAPARPAPAPLPGSTAPAVPAPIAPGYEETGDASWYGHPYHGRKAASGETYDMNQMTAAHRTLPFGTRIRVESLVDGSAVEVRINDRGPFKDDKRILDLSYAAAKLLGVVGPGVIPIKLRVVSVPGMPSASAGSVATPLTPPPPRPSAPAASPVPATMPPTGVAAISPPATPVSSAPAAASAPSAPSAPASAPAAAPLATPAPSTPPIASAAPVAGQTPISPSVQAAPPIVAETAVSKPEPTPRVEAAVRVPAPPAPTLPAPAPPAPAPAALTPPVSSTLTPAARAPVPVPPASATPVTEGWSVQLGAYASESSAISLRETLARSWPDARVLRTEVSGRTLWRVRVGHYASRRDADEAAKRLNASGYRAMVVEAGRP